MRRRALVGQLVMIALGVGVFIGGVVISTVGLTFVFGPTDLQFMHTDAATLKSANAHLLPFIAHDRAGFGGALMATTVAIVLLGLWGWWRGMGVVDVARCDRCRVGQCAGDPLLHPLHRVHPSAAGVFR
ncbi:hypothetical protein ACWEO2_05385 [Nocardia sp. NPDC004278]